MRPDDQTKLLYERLFDRWCRQSLSKSTGIKRVAVVASLFVAAGRTPNNPLLIYVLHRMMEVGIYKTLTRTISYTTNHVQLLVTIYNDLLLHDDHSDFAKQKKLTPMLSKIIANIVCDYKQKKNKLTSSAESESLLNYLGSSDDSTKAVELKLNILLDYLIQEEDGVLCNEGRTLFNTAVGYLGQPDKDFVMYCIGTPKLFDILFPDDAQFSRKKMIFSSIPEIANAKDVKDARTAVKKIMRIAAKAAVQGAKIDVLERNSLFADLQKKKTGLCFDVLENVRSFLSATQTTVVPYQPK
ncbi:MAG TPA: hypothetical protein VJK30_03390 [Coxiellaceae bacterium]|nr:MAG: hypothetical protein A3E81_03380 [Gammaproteobacteria bacterium RIFCSPHIGHO2_12_FULL_36_30]HLB56358.1 hypothetical protein [Coxiellaceae bacterium]